MPWYLLTHASYLLYLSSTHAPLAHDTLMRLAFFIFYFDGPLLPAFILYIRLSYHLFNFTHQIARRYHQAFDTEARSLVSGDAVYHAAPMPRRRQLPLSCVNICRGRIL